MKRTARGQTLVEFALLLPILLVILMMIFDIGRAIYYYSVIHNAAREGARYGIVAYHSAVSSTDLKDDIELHAKELVIGIDPAEVQVAPINFTWPIETGEFIEVTVIWNFTAVTPLVNLIPSLSSFEISSTSRMYFEK